MKKRLLLTVLAALLLLASIGFTALAAQGESFEVGGITYRVRTEDSATKTGTVAIDKISGWTDELLIIPETVEKDGYTYTVDYYDTWYHELNKSITQLYVPKTVTDSDKPSSVGGSGAHAPIFTERNTPLVVYITNPELGRMWVGAKSNSSGGYSFDETTAIACLNGGSIKDDALWDSTVGVLNGADVFEREGYTFGGWYDNQFFTGVPITERPSTQRVNERYYALWIPDAEHSLVMTDNNFGTADLGDTLNAGDTYTVPECSYSVSGYAFNHWTLNVYSDGVWHELQNLNPGEHFNLEGSTLYRLTAKWRLATSREESANYVNYSFADNEERSIVFSAKKDNGPNGGEITYQTLSISSFKVNGVNEKSFKWYKKDADGEWRAYTDSINSYVSGNTSYSILTIYSVTQSGTYKCVVTSADGKYSCERTVTINVSPAKVTLSPSAQYISQNGELKAAASDTLTLKDAPYTLKANDVYSKVTLKIKDGVDVSAPGIYEDAITVVDNGLEEIADAENYEYVFTTADLIVKAVPTVVWNTQNTYRYTYTGAPISSGISASLVGKDGFGEPTGSLKLLYNGSETVPTNVGEYTVTAVYTSNSKYYDSCTAVCDTRLVIERAAATVKIMPLKITLGASLPSLSADNLLISSETLTAGVKSALKSKLSTAINNGTLSFVYEKDGSPVNEAASVGIYTVTAEITSEALDALDTNVSLAFSSAGTDAEGTGYGTLTVRNELTVNMQNMTATYTGGRIAYKPELLTHNGGEGVVFEYSYLLDGGWQSEAPITVGKYTVRARFAGNELYAEKTVEATLEITPADVRIVAKDKIIGRGDSLDDVVFTADEVEILANGLENDFIDDIRSFINEMFEYDFMYLTLTVSGAAAEDAENAVTFMFNLDGTVMSLDQLAAFGLVPITPDNAATMGLYSYIFDNANFYFEKGNLDVREKMTVDFVGNETFTLEDADESLGSLGIYKVFVTEFANKELPLSAENVILNGVEGVAAPSGNIRFEYMYEGDDFYSEWAPFFGNYAVKITVEGDENYVGTVAYALVSVTPAKIEVNAKDQVIAPNGEIALDASAVELSGSILSDPEMGAFLSGALTDLFDMDIFSLSLNGGVDISTVGVYKNALVMTVDYESLASIPESEFFEISSRNGVLTVEVVYPLWVGGVQVTSTNSSDIFGDGSARYNGDSSTLTLNGFDYSSTPYALRGTDEAVIYSEGIDLKLVLKGENRISSSGGAGIYTKSGALSITSESESGSLTVDGATHGIASDGAISVKNATLSVKGGSGAFNKAVAVDSGLAVFVENGESDSEFIESPDSATFSNSQSYVTISSPFEITLNYGGYKEIISSFLYEAPAARTLEGTVFAGWYDDAALTLPHDFSLPVSKNTTLYAKFTDYTADIEEIDGAIAELESAIAALEDALNTKASSADLISALNELNIAKQNIVQISDGYKAADSALSARIDALEASADGISDAALGELRSRVEELENALDEANGKINSNATDITALKSDLSALNDRVSEAEELLSALEGTAPLPDSELAELDAAIEALRTELQTADGSISSLEERIDALENRTDALESAKSTLEEALANLENTIAKKADAEAMKEAIEELWSAIDALDAVKNAYAQADGELKSELEAAIEKAKNEAIEAYRSYVPYIGENGNWWIGDTDSGISAAGLKGDKGDDGNGILSITAAKLNGSTVITVKFTDPSVEDAVFVLDGVGAEGDSDSESTATNESVLTFAAATGGTVVVSNLILTAIILLRRKRRYW